MTEWDKPLTDDEWEELQANDKKLKAAYAKDPVRTEAALKDALKSLQNERGIAPMKGKLPKNKG